MLIASLVPIHLAVQDANGLQATGVRSVRAGEEVIRAGVAPDHFFVVLEGELVSRGGDPAAREDAHAMAAPPVEERMGPGALLWDASRLRRTGPRSVRAATDAVLLCIPPLDVDTRLREDPAFEGRLVELAVELARKHRESAARAARANGGTGGESHARLKGGGPGARPSSATLHIPDAIEKMLEGDFPT